MKMEAYSHWRGTPGDIYSEKQARPTTEVAAEGKAIKVGAHVSGPALGYNSTFLHRR